MKITNITSEKGHDVRVRLCQYEHFQKELKPQITPENVCSVTVELKQIIFKT